MIVLRRFSGVLLSSLVRDNRRKLYCAALMVLCEMAFLSPAAWGQRFFIYRDLNTGIYSNAQQFVSHRYMRHLWITQDGVMATAVQKGGYQGHGLVFYKTLNNGLNWTLETTLSSERDIVSDGMMDENNHMLLVTSLITENQTADVDFLRLIYDSASQAWSLDPLTPVTVFASSDQERATRATLAEDSNGVIWCAFRLENVTSGIFQIKVFYSTDAGYTWADSGNSFGTPNGEAERSAKVIAVGSRIAMIYQDVQADGWTTERYKGWAYREDSQPLQDGWTSELIAQMVATGGDPFGSHWSVAADHAGNLHLSYEDEGIRYLKYDAATQGWVGPLVAATFNGSYNSISVAANNDLYLFCQFSGFGRVFAKRYSAASETWSWWVSMSSRTYGGYLRMSSPERFDVLLPLVYQVNVTSPYELLFSLFNTAR